MARAVTRWRPWKTNRKRSGRCNFNPEVHHTQRGVDRLRNFVINSAGVVGTGQPQHFIDESIRQVRQTVGEQGRVICALSSGRRGLRCGCHAGR